ncbi:MAG: EAL domain-containing protein [Kiloniellaceae bacterium]
MRALLHLALFASYAGLAAAAALRGPPWLPQLDRIPAYGLGALIFLAGGLLHEVYARTRHAARLRERLLAASRAHAAQQDELAWLRREVQGLREALEAAGKGGDIGRGGRTVDEVMAEVKVLKSLMERLSLRPGAPPAAAGRPDAAGARALPAVPTPAKPAVAAAGAPAPGTSPPLALDLDRDAVLDAVREALRNDRIDLVLQPIVSLPQRKRRFYECFSRLRTGDGAMILPDQYIAVAEHGGLVTAIDNMLLFRCVQLIRKIQRTSQNVDFFCNISPHTLADGAFFSDFIDFLENNDELAAHLIFEFAQADFARWSEVGARLLERLAHLGCRFSLDQVNDLDLDPAGLAARQISFVKVEAELLLKALASDIDPMRALRRRHIDLIVEKVEDEGRLLELLDHDIDFGQGYLFGEPRLARPAA